MTLPQVLWVMTLPLAALFLIFLPGWRGAGRAVPVAAWGVVLAGVAGDLGALAFQHELTTWEPVEAWVVLSERGARRYDWRFQYEYTWEGRTYRGSRLTYAPRWRSREDTDHLAEAYPEGEPITVFVDPDRPERASVNAGPRWALPGGAFALHGALAGVLLLHRRRRQREAPAGRREAGPEASGPG